MVYKRGKDKGIYGCRSLRELVKYFAKEMEAAEGCVIRFKGF